MQKIQTNRTDIEVFVLSAGKYYADAGAAMGVLPYKLWHDKIKYDESHRILLELNCLLLKTPQKNILVDTGIGEYLSEKHTKIYAPTKFQLLYELALVGLDKGDINLIAFTHLHFDHAGGIINSAKELIFENAKYIVQKDEWDTAMNPDTLNKASYSINEHYQILAQSNLVETIEGNHEIADNVLLKKVGGHCVGMQVLSIDDQGEVIYFAGDIFPSRFHLNPSVTSAYDICREKVCKEKIRIKDELIKKGGKLILGHEMQVIDSQEKSISVK